VRAACASINPDVRAHADRCQRPGRRPASACSHWADVVIGAVDNREARVFINSACARVGKAVGRRRDRGPGRRGAGVPSRRSGRLLRVHDERHRSPAPGRAALVRAAWPGPRWRAATCRPRRSPRRSSARWRSRRRSSWCTASRLCVGAGLHVDGLMERDQPRDLPAPGRTVRATSTWARCVPLGLGTRRRSRWARCSIAPRRRLGPGAVPRSVARRDRAADLPELRRPPRRGARCWARCASPRPRARRAARTAWSRSPSSVGRDGEVDLTA
jgi:hypothetical protein